VEDQTQKFRFSFLLQICHIRFRGFRLTQLYFNYPLYVSVVRPSSSGKYTHQKLTWLAYFCMLFAWLALIILNLGVCILLRVLAQVQGIRLTQLYFNSCLLFYSNYPLHVSVVRPSSSGNIHIHLKMVVRPKHVAANLNKIVNNYSNRAALDGNPWSWSNTRHRMQTTKFKNTSHIHVFLKTMDAPYVHFNVT
jgi:hypothetical protein